MVSKQLRRPGSGLSRKPASVFSRWTESHLLFFDDHQGRRMVME
jgi:hypothetical protein